MFKPNFQIIIRYFKYFNMLYIEKYISSRKGNKIVA